MRQRPLPTRMVLALELTPVTRPRLASLAAGVTPIHPMTPSRIPAMSRILLMSLTMVRRRLRIPIRPPNGVVTLSDTYRKVAVLR